MNSMGWYSYNPKDVVRIYEDEYVAVDYNKSGKIYRVTIFEDGHFKDEFWFDAYGDKEGGAPGEAERFRCPHCKEWMTTDDAVY